MQNAETLAPVMHKKKTSSMLHSKMQPRAKNQHVLGADRETSGRRKMRSLDMEERNDLLKVVMLFLAVTSGASL